MSKHGINLACVLKHPVNDNTANEVRRGLRLNGDYTKGKKMKCSLLFYIKKKKKSVSSVSFSSMPNYQASFTGSFALRSRTGSGCH